MTFPSGAAWARISRPFEIQDQAGAVLGQVPGVLRGFPERDLEGAALAYDALLVVRTVDLDTASLPRLHPFQRVRDVTDGALFVVEGTRTSHGPGGGSIQKANLTGLNAQ